MTNARPGTIMVATGVVLAALVLPTAYGALSPRNFAIICIAVAAASFLALLRAFKAAERTSVDRSAQTSRIKRYFLASVLSVWLITALWLTRGGPWPPRLIGATFLSLLIFGNLRAKK